LRKTAYITYHKERSDVKKSGNLKKLGGICAPNFLYSTPIDEACQRPVPLYIWILLFHYLCVFVIDNSK